MKRMVLMAIAMVLFLASSAFAQDANDVNTEKISGFVNFQSNFIQKEHSSEFEQATQVLLRSGDTAGNAGIYAEYNYNGTAGCERIRFWLLEKVSDSVDVLIGTISNNKGNDFFGVRIWYTDNFPILGKSKLLLDAAYYVGKENQKNTYTDNSVRITYPINNRLSVGVDGVFDYWTDDGHGMVLVGPRVSYKIGSAIVAARYSHDWNRLDTGTAQTNQGRIEVTFPF